MRQRVNRKGRSAPVTVKEVARQAGVSTATVSRVLSGAVQVTEDLRERVLSAAAALNYHPNRAARNLRVGFNRSVGILIPDIENPFYTSLVRGVEQVLQAGGYSLLLANYNESSEQEKTYLSQMQAEGVAGLLFSASREPGAAYADLARAGIPAVAVSRKLANPSIDQVTVDNEGGAYSAVKHLLELGHLRIGLINGPQALSTSQERYDGYHAALRESAIKPVKQLVQHCDFRQTGGYLGMQKLLSLNTAPTAVFVASNLMTLGALQAIHEAGLDIPGQIALVGFDEMPWAVSLRPPLTTVAQPINEVGQTAARLLLERIQNFQLPRREVLLKTELIVRSSCGSHSHAAAVPNGKAISNSKPGSKAVRLL